MADVLGAFEQVVLLSVLRLQDEAYGSAVALAVQSRLQRHVSYGAVQATLVRLQAKHLVSSRLGPGTPIRAGHPRRYYVLKPKGLLALDEARQTLKDIWRGVQLPRPEEL